MSATLAQATSLRERAAAHRQLRNAEDRRSVSVSLTEQGFAVIDATLEAHVATQKRLTSGLSADEHHMISALLSKFMLSLEGE
ncbi:MAG: hypothetical protein K0U59_03605 [Gammaproteobacteria bacterium]|nr:hypothetical protein [Gammaproteobacteria bacterium]